MTQKVRPWQIGITECDPKSTRTTPIEEFGYIWIVLKELVRMALDKSQKS